jgi:hypothetical protein
LITRDNRLGAVSPSPIATSLLGKRGMGNADIRALVG